MLLLLLILVGSIVYPLLVTGFAVIFAPATAAGQQWAGANQTGGHNGTNNTTAVLGHVPMEALGTPGGAATTTDHRWTSARPSHPLQAYFGWGSPGGRVRTCPDAARLSVGRC